MDQKNNFKKANVFFLKLREELSKTRFIGKKMWDASLTNAALKSSYEELGHYVMNCYREKNLDWYNEGVFEFLKKIENLEKDMAALENDIQKVK